MSKDKPEKIKNSAVDSSIAIIAARYNKKFVEQLIENTVKTLMKSGLKDEMIEIFRVPGSNEIPYTASMVAETDEFDCIICLGVIIAGDTKHHEIISFSANQTLQQVSIRQETPIINGIITVENIRQAEDRCMGRINRGKEFAEAALEMCAVDDALTDRIYEDGIEDDDLEASDHAEFFDFEKN